jgi:hypothetical protein
MTCAALLLVAGCGGGYSGPPLYPAQGVVTYNGQPVAGATVQFNPPEEVKLAPLAMAITNEKGEFTIKSAGHPGAIEATFRVTVVKAESTSTDLAKAADANDPEAQMKAMGEHIKKMMPDVEKAKQRPDPKTLKSGAKSLIPVKYAELNSTPLTVTIKKGDPNNTAIKLELTD